MPFSQLNELLERFPDAFRLAIVGGADESADAVLRHWLHGIFFELKGENLIIVTGGTNDGVPGHAAAWADMEHIPVLGIMPQKWESQRSPELPKYGSHGIQNALVVIPPQYGESRSGDETPTLIKMSDALLVIGGQWGTMIELATAMKENARRWKKQQPLISIVTLDIAPNAASPNVAQVACKALSFSDTAFRDACIRRCPQNTPEDAASFLRALLTQSRYRPVS